MPLERSEKEMDFIMKNKMLIVAIFWVVLILVVGLILIIKNEKEEMYEGGIVSISYSYGVFHGGDLNYEIYKANGQTFIKA